MAIIDFAKVREARLAKAARAKAEPYARYTAMLEALDKVGIEYEKLEDAIRRVFGRKGEAIVEANIKALAIGREAQK